MDTNTQTHDQPKKSRLPRNKKLFWMFYILSIITLVLGIALLPLWAGTGVIWESLGNDFFSMILFCIILVYILGFLIKQIIKEKKVAVKILTVFEAGFFFAIAIGCIMEQFDLVSVVGPCTIAGAALWSRGFVYIVKAYLCKHDESDKYPLWMLVVSVGLVTLGSIMMTQEIFSVGHIVWAVSVILIFIAIMFFFLGIISKPKIDKAMKQYKREQRALKKQEKITARQEKRTLKAEARLRRIEEEEKPTPALPVPTTTESAPEASSDTSADSNA